MKTSFVRLTSIFKILLALLIALGLAYGSVEWTLDQKGQPLRNGPWETDLRAGSEQAGAYQRARIAKHGIWALASSEVIYYTANRDSMGEPLEQNQTYEIAGNQLDTRWWSVTTYVDDHFIPNDDNCYSYSSTSVQREPNGNWVILASSEKQVANWLPLGTHPGSLCFALRCYNPGERLTSSPESVSLPTITRVVLP